MQPAEPSDVDLEDGRDSDDPAVLEIPAESTAVNPLAVSTHRRAFHALRDFGRGSTGRCSIMKSTSEWVGRMHEFELHNARNVH
jgi:hypothetical protein